MSQFARSRSCNLVPTVVFLLSFIILQVVLVPSAFGAGARKLIAVAAGRVVAGGVKAKIPPHVSEMLGTTPDIRECPVMQQYERSGKLVRGFNVSVADKNNIVLFVTDEAANEQTYYLTSDQGELLRVVAVKGGTGNTLRITSKQKAAFQKEVRYWLDRIVPGKATEAHRN